MEQKEKDRVFSEEFNLYKQRFNRVSRMHNDFARSLSAANKVAKFEIARYVSSIMPMVLNNLSAKHQEICALKNADGADSGYSLLATPSGIRTRWRGYTRSTRSTRSNDLDSSALYQAFIDDVMSKQVEAWILNHRPDKVQGFWELQSVLRDGFDKRFLSLNKDRYDAGANAMRLDNNLSESIPVGFVSSSRHDEDIMSIQNSKVSMLSFVFDVMGNSFQLYFVNNGSSLPEDVDRYNMPSGVKFFEYSNALMLVEARSLLPHIEAMYKRAQGELDVTIRGINGWFDNIKKRTQKYVVLQKL
jgi:hypothetical protein